MTLADALWLTGAFLAPLPPERGFEPRRVIVNGWLVGFAAAFLVAVTLMPLSLALAEHWALTRLRDACTEAGGRVTHVTTHSASTDRHPFRCDPR